MDTATASSGCSRRPLDKWVLRSPSSTKHVCSLCFCLRGERMKQITNLTFGRAALLYFQKSSQRRGFFFFFFNFTFLWPKSHLSVHLYVCPFTHPSFSRCDLGLCSGEDKVVELSGNWKWAWAYTFSGYLLLWCFSVFSFRTFQQIL